MRNNLYNEFEVTEAHDLLTTGEAAIILNSSRQHVVDLCERGDLPFTNVGSHRRVRRSDIELIRSRSDRLNRDQRRSLWMAYLIAGKIAAKPDPAIEIAISNLKRMKPTARGQAKLWLKEWEELLTSGDTEKLIRTLVSPSPKSRELRQNSPFSGLLSDEERLGVMDSWRQSTSKQ